MNTEKLIEPPAEFPGTTDSKPTATVVNVTAAFTYPAPRQPILAAATGTNVSSAVPTV
jgi:hypothetical protein